jgi:hypothetical protein
MGGKAMLTSVKSVVAIISLSLFITECAPRGVLRGEKKDLAIIPTAPIIAFTEAQIGEAINKATWGLDNKVGETSLSDVPLLNFKKSLKDYRPHRALAIGYPNECGGSWHSWNRSSEDLAAKAALRGCLQLVSGRDKHVRRECGARLVMVNKGLIVRPEELPDQFRKPFIAETKSLRVEEGLIYGMYQHEGLGEDLPLILFDDKGTKICEGRYSYSKIHALLGSGKFEMQCLDNQLRVQGALSAKRVRIRNMPGSVWVGIGKGRASDGSDFNFLTGITIDDYEDYKYLLK